jgi:hypothetical protein
MIPIRLHSRTMVESGTLASADSVMFGVLLVERGRGYSPMPAEISGEARTCLGVDCRAQLFQAPTVE